MPILIALVVAVIVVTLVLLVVSHRSRVAAAAITTPATTTPAVVELVEQMHRHPALRRFVAERRDATKATGWLLTVALATIAALTLVIGLVLEMVQAHEGFAKWDDAAARWGAAHTSGSAEAVLRVVTAMGSTPFVIALCVVVSIVELRRTSSRSAAVFLATVVASQVVLTNLIKVTVGRDRPDIGRLVAASGFSFPSGHTAASAAVYAGVALVIGRRRSRRTRATLAATAVLVTIAVAISRVLLGAHWLTDVIAGAALGWACFALCSIAFGGRLLHFGAPVEQAEHLIATEPLAVAMPPSHTPRSHP